MKINRIKTVLALISLVITGLEFSGSAIGKPLKQISSEGSTTIENPCEPSKKLSHQPELLKSDKLRNYVKKFNNNDHTHFGQAISNQDAANWMADNIPLFECPDKEIEEIYYFRWWTFRKHIQNTPEGFVITEFLPKVNWSGKYNTISSK